MTASKAAPPAISVTSIDQLTNAAILEIAKPSGGMGVVRPLIASAARGGIDAMREIRNGYDTLSRDVKRSLVMMAAAGECATIIGRLAASHGEVDDIFALADILVHSAYLFELSGDDVLCQSRLIEAIGLYRRLGYAGHSDSAYKYQMLAAAMPPSVIERVDDDCNRLALEAEGSTTTASERVH